ncbi:LuxR C-terminal-related transcriptional regulator, partial [Actinoplanes sp. NPDC051633]|uniref:LuxR C-terminal-related transcriptional regulator n=1 Tax=Actinoplanes sp. NPDC051633 TaxID=3155670 RepID=UPI003434D4CD
GPAAAELWAALGQALGAAGRLGEARFALLRALAATPDEAIPSRVPLIADCARIEHTLGHHDAAHQRLTAALDRLGDAHPAESVRLMDAIAQDHLFRLEFPDAVAWAGRTRAAADPSQIAEAATSQALTAALAGVEGDAAAACAEAATLVDAMTDEEIGASPDPIAARLAAAELFTGSLRDAARHAERALEVSRHHVPVMFWAGTVRIALGRLPAAAALLDEAVDVARTSGNASMLGWVLLARSTVAAVGGDADTARSAAEESVELHGATANTLPAVWARLALAGALVESAEPAAAERLLLGDLELVPPPLRPAAHELLVRCRLALGRGTGAAGGPMTGRAAAMIALHEGRPAEAADLALQAASSAERRGAVVDCAAARGIAATALAEAGDRDEAVRQLQMARAIYDRCGAPRRRAETERQLRRLGDRRVHHRTRPGDGAGRGVGSLTERESQVAGLITDRRTNAEIAAALHLSTKTVETHIRSLFNKLGVTSRVEIARTMERNDPGTSTPESR